jgi:ATP-dependent DNA helicase RecG
MHKCTLCNPGRAEATRVENFPYAAIEEAVVNAVYHRGYDTREPIEIRLECDEMMIISYPGPDRSVRLDQLQAGRAQPWRYRNRHIGEFLKELEFTEGRCTGISKIIEAKAKNGSPPAEFGFDEDHSYFLVRLPVHPAAREVAESATGQEPGKIGVPQGLPSVAGWAAEAGTESGSGWGQVGAKPGLSRHQVEILSKCLADAGIAELMTIAERTNRTKFRGQVPKPLLADNLLAMTIPDKPTSRNQRYRITDKEHALLVTLPTEKTE